MNNQVRITITSENGKVETQGNCSPADMISLLEIAKFSLLQAGTSARPIAGPTDGTAAVTRAPNFRPAPVA